MGPSQGPGHLWEPWAPKGPGGLCPRTLCLPMVACISCKARLVLLGKARVSQEPGVDPLKRFVIL